MSLANYSDLSAAVQGWLNRSDLAGNIPDFVRLTEASLNRKLRDPDQVLSATLNLSNGSGTLPVGFGELVAFGAQGYSLNPVSPSEFASYNQLAGDPLVYTISGGTISVNPSQASASVPITYYQAIPPLTVANATNWLMTRAPDVYLYGCLLQAEFYGWNDERLPLIKSAYDEAVGDLMADGAGRKYGVGAAARVRRG